MIRRVHNVGGNSNLPASTPNGVVQNVRAYIGDPQKSGTEAREDAQIVAMASYRIQQIRSIAMKNAEKLN